MAHFLVLLPGSKQARNTSTAVENMAFSLASRRFHSVRAWPLQWPANCKSLSPSDHLFHMEARSSAVSQSSSCKSKFSPEKGRMGGALPRLTSPEGTLMDGAVVHSPERGRRGGGGEVGVVVEASGVVHSPAIL